MPYSEDGTEQRWGAILEYLRAKGANLEVFNNRAQGRHTPYEKNLIWGLNAAVIKELFEAHYKEIRKQHGFLYGKIMALEQTLPSPNGPVKKE